MFEKNRCIDNIYALAKKKGLKIGEMEERAGVSKGYLSRINKEDSTANPPIDFLVSIAEQLEVSVDFLLMYSDADLNKNEAFIIEFVDRLSQKTIQGDIDWVLQARSVLTADNSDPVDNPLIDIVPDYSDEFDMKYMTHGFTSHFYNNAFILDDCYYCYLPEQPSAKVYVMNVRYTSFAKNGTADIYRRDYQDAFELYLCSRNDISPICSTAYVKKEIANTVKNLYETINMTSSHLGLTPNAKSIMQNFLKS
ncbi:MAG: helix-turn-helix domain-containing protein [Clostridiaceae bacterium]|nr:helix-turn-helix domain-containing protein [Clostridiaceae bacterium]